MHPNPDLGYTTLYEGTLFGDTDIRVEDSQTTGDANRPAGIVFWAANFLNYFLATHPRGWPPRYFPQQGREVLTGRLPSKTSTKR